MNQGIHAPLIALYDVAKDEEFVWRAVLCAARHTMCELFGALY